jgi:hypothetical protein
MYTFLTASVLLDNPDVDKDTKESLSKYRKPGRNRDSPKERTRKPPQRTCFSCLVKHLHSLQRHPVVDDDNEGGSSSSIEDLITAQHQESWVSGTTVSVPAPTRPLAAIHAPTLNPIIPPAPASPAAPPHSSTWAAAPPLAAFLVADIPPALAHAHPL